MIKGSRIQVWLLH